MVEVYSKPQLCRGRLSPHSAADREDSQEVLAPDSRGSHLSPGPAKTCVLKPIV